MLPPQNTRLMLLGFCKKEGEKSSFSSPFLALWAPGFKEGSSCPPNSAHPTLEGLGLAEMGPVGPCPAWEGDPQLPGLRLLCSYLGLVSWQPLLPSPFPKEKNFHSDWLLPFKGAGILSAAAYAHAPSCRTYYNFIQFCRQILKRHLEKLIAYQGNEFIKVFFF